MTTTHKVLDQQTIDVLQGVSDRLNWLAQGTPPSEIRRDRFTDEEMKRRYGESGNGETEKPCELQEDNLVRSSRGRAYLSGCWVNEDLVGSQIFIYTNRRFLSDLLLDAVNTTPYSTPPTTLFLLRTFMEVWAVYLQGLEAISDLPGRPKIDDEESLESFRKENVHAVAFLNWSSFSDPSKIAEEADNLTRDKDDPLKAGNVIKALQKFDHLIPGFKKAYDLCCHFIHPSAAIRQMYVTQTRYADFGLIKTNATTLKESVAHHRASKYYRKSSEQAADLFESVILECETNLRQYEKSAETRIATLSKKQAKTNKEIARFVAEDRQLGSALPCFCGKRKLIKDCCGK